MENKDEFDKLMGKIYYHFGDIAGRTLPRSARLLKNLPEFEMC
jgi:hypothetical protein